MRAPLWYGLAVTAAHPLPEDFQDEPLDAACLDRMSPEERALAEASLERLANGTTGRVPHAEVMAKLEALHRTG
jgi:hypothetical protein